MNPFETLSEKENKELLKFPAYISMLAVSRDNTLDADEKRSAIRSSHIKSYVCDPLLSDFYKEAGSVYLSNIGQLNKELPKDKNSKEAAIKLELFNLDRMVLKLEKDYASAMHVSMEAFIQHVSKSQHDALKDFVIEFQYQD